MTYSDTCNGKTVRGKNVGVISHADISSVLEKIVNTASGKGPPLSVYSANAQGNESRVWRALLDKQHSFELKLDTSLSDWITYVELVAPSRRIKVSKLAVKILQTLNTKPDALIEDFKMKLNVPDVVYILNTLTVPSSAYIFYTWLRKQPYYIPHKSVYGALFERLSSIQPSPDIWNKLNQVMEDMLWKKIALDSDQFGRLLAMGYVCSSKEESIARMEWYLDWFSKMRTLRFLPSSLIYEKLMLMCNHLQMYEVTLSIFEEIPRNMYLWSFKLALFACRGLVNLEIAERLFEQMKSLAIKPDIECYIVILGLYAHNGYADRVENLFEEMKQTDIAFDLCVYTSIIRAHAKVGKLKEAYLIFKSVSINLDSGIYEAMAACFRDAGYIKELLDLIDEAHMHGLHLGSECYEATFQACTEKCQWRSSVDIIKYHWTSGNVLPSPSVFCMLLYACRMVNDYSACENFPYEMIWMELQSQETFEETIKMYASCGKISCAMDTFKLMKDRGQFPSDPEFYEQIISLILGKSLSDAMILFHDMRYSNHVPALSLYTSLIGEHVKSGDLMECKKLFDDMLVAGVKPALINITKERFRCSDECILSKGPIFG